MKNLRRSRSVQQKPTKSNNVSPSLQEPRSNDIDQQEMIDTLVNEFMPKIESRLRLRLAKALDKASKK